MREDDGRKLDHATLQALRVHAVRRIIAGEHPEAVAQALGFTRSTVYGWLAKYRTGGLPALAAKPIPGRPTKLTPTQRNRLYALVTGATPDELGLISALWTRDLVRTLITRDFQITLAKASVGRLLHHLDLAPRIATGEWKAEIRAVGTKVFFLATTNARQDDVLLHARTATGPVHFAVYPGPIDETTRQDFLDRLRRAATDHG
jgi:transposase